MANLDVGLAIAGIWIGAGIMGRGSDQGCYISFWAAIATIPAAFGFAG